MPVPDEYPFHASSPVLRYWLINGVGFAVCGADGRELGVVEDVVVDPLRQHAEQVIVRRRGAIVVRRRTRIDARSVEAVSPAAQRFLVESASGGASVGGVASATVRLRASAAFALVAVRVLARAAAPLGRAMRRAGSDSRALARELLRLLAAGLRLAGHVTRLGARAGAHATVAAAGRVRRESPRLEAWLSSSTRSAATRLAAAARVVARVLGDLAVLAAVFVAAASRRAAAASRSRTPPADGADERRDPDTVQWRSDADAPLGRETDGEAPPPAREQPEATTRRSPPESDSDRRSDR